MAEWLVEEGIGEHRAVLVEGGEICAARLEWPGSLMAGQVEDAKLVSRVAGTPRGAARFANGEVALVDRLPPDAREGMTLRLEVTRAMTAERDRFKDAQARPSTNPLRAAPSLAERLDGRVVREVEGWEELWSEALHGEVEFRGGRLTIEPTAGMTVIDVDGSGAPRELALAAIPTLAKAIRRFDLSGAIAIDFPSIAEKPGRRAVDSALAEYLADWPHERTAMNGFGLVQLVARREGPSMLALLARRPDAAARMLMRRAERVSEPGILELSANPRVRAAVRDGWEAELVRRTGRTIRWREEPGLALIAAFAQGVGT